VQRRNALKTLTLAVGGIMFLPACDRWTKESVQLEQPFLSPGQEEVLAALSDTLIPTTPDIPGATALAVPAFVERMLKDCYEAELQEGVLRGLDALDAEARRQFGTPFDASSPAQREQLLAAMEQGQLPPAEPQANEADTNTNNPQTKGVAPGMDTPGVDTPGEAAPDAGAELAGVFALLKGLCIRGYLSSEWVMRNHYNYQQMPGHYSGCVPVATPQQPLF
jgi:hypothetical protein